MDYCYCTWKNFSLETGLISFHQGEKWGLSIFNSGSSKLSDTCLRLLKSVGLEGYDSFKDRTLNEFA